MVCVGEITNIVVTDAVLREKAKQFGAEFSIGDFRYSNGWLLRFKMRCGIIGQVICGESAGVDPEVISHGRERAINWIKVYTLQDVYNLGETSLFFRMLPDRSLTTADKTKGVKKPKDRISVMLCCNADGSDKVKPLIIAKHRILAVLNSSARICTAITMQTRKRGW